MIVKRIKIITVFLIVAFFAQDLSWAYPDYSAYNHSSKNKLAPAPFLERVSPENRLVDTIIFLIEQNPHVSVKNLILDGVEAILRKNQDFLDRNGISFSRSKKEIRIDIGSDIILRYIPQKIRMDSVLCFMIRSQERIGILERQVLARFEKTLPPVLKQQKFDFTRSIEEAPPANIIKVSEAPALNTAQSNSKINAALKSLFKTLSRKMPLSYRIREAKDILKKDIDEHGYVHNDAFIVFSGTVLRVLKKWIMRDAKAEEKIHNKLDEIRNIIKKRDVKAPKGSVAGVFEYLCSPDIQSLERPLRADEVAINRGLAYDTIRRDLWALYYHLHLLEKWDVRESGPSARYYVPQRIKDKYSDIYPILKQFIGKKLRPEKKDLEDAYRAIINRIGLRDPSTDKYNLVPVSKLTDYKGRFDGIISCYKYEREKFNIGVECASLYIELTPLAGGWEKGFIVSHQENILAIYDVKNDSIKHAYITREPKENGRFNLGGESYRLDKDFEQGRTTRRIRIHAFDGSDLTVNGLAGGFRVYYLDKQIAYYDKRRNEMSGISLVRKLEPAGANNQEDARDPLEVKAAVAFTKFAAHCREEMRLIRQYAETSNPDNTKLCADNVRLCMDRIKLYKKEDFNGLELIKLIWFITEDSMSDLSLIPLFANDKVFNRDMIFNVLDNTENAFKEFEKLVAAGRLLDARNAKTTSGRPDASLVLKGKVKNKTAKPPEAVKEFEAAVLLEPETLTDIDVLFNIQTLDQIKNNTKILLSENLFIKDGDETELNDIRTTLTRLLDSEYIIIMKPDEMRKIAMNRIVSKNKLAAVFTEQDFNNEKIWKGCDKETALRSSILILGDRLMGNNYLYLKGSIGLARAIMENDEDAIRAYYVLMSGTHADNQMRMPEFKPITDTKPEVLKALKVKMEDSLNSLPGGEAVPLSKDEITARLSRLQNIRDKKTDEITEDDKQYLVGVARYFNFYAEYLEEETDKEEIRIYAIRLYILTSAELASLSLPDVPVFAWSAVDDIGNSFFAHELLHLFDDMHVLGAIDDKWETSQHPDVQKEIDRIVNMVFHGKYYGENIGWRDVLVAWKKVRFLNPKIILALIDGLAKYIEEIVSMRADVVKYIEEHRDEIGEKVVNKYLVKAKISEGECAMNLTRLKTIKQNVLHSNENALIDINESIRQSSQPYKEDDRLEMQLQQLDPNMPPIYGNAVKVSYVWANLFRNSIDAILEMKDTDKSKQGMLTVKTQAVVKDNKEFIEVSVNDNGIGIPEELLQGGRLFEKEMTTKEDGSGLGLYLIKETVEELSGTIDVQSEVGKGTTFIITLPTKADASPLAAGKSGKQKFPLRPESCSLGIFPGNYSIGIYGGLTLDAIGEMTTAISKNKFKTLDRFEKLLPWYEGYEMNFVVSHVVPEETVPAFIFSIVPEDGNLTIVFSSEELANLLADKFKDNLPQALELIASNIYKQHLYMSRDHKSRADAQRMTWEEIMKKDPVITKQLKGLLIEHFCLISEKVINNLVAPLSEDRKEKALESLTKLADKGEKVALDVLTRLTQRIFEISVEDRLALGGRARSALSTLLDLGNTEIVKLVEGFIDDETPRSHFGYDSTLDAHIDLLISAASHGNEAARQALESRRQMFITKASGKSKREFRKETAYKEFVTMLSEGNQKEILSPLLGYLKMGEDGYWDGENRQKTGLVYVLAERAIKGDTFITNILFRRVLFNSSIYINVRWEAIEYWKLKVCGAYPSTPQERKNGIAILKKAALKGFKISEQKRIMEKMHEVSRILEQKGMPAEDILWDFFPLHYHKGVRHFTLEEFLKTLDLITDIACMLQEKNIDILTVKKSGQKEADLHFNLFDLKFSGYDPQVALRAMELSLLIVGQGKDYRKGIYAFADYYRGIHWYKDEDLTHSSRIFDKAFEAVKFGLDLKGVIASAPHIYATEGLYKFFKHIDWLMTLDKNTLNYLFEEGDAVARILHKGFSDFQKINIDLKPLFEYLINNHRISLLLSLSKLDISELGGKGYENLLQGIFRQVDIESEISMFAKFLAATELTEILSIRDNELKTLIGWKIENWLQSMPIDKVLERVGEELVGAFSSEVIPIPDSKKDFILNEDNFNYLREIAKERDLARQNQDIFQPGFTPRVPSTAFLYLKGLSQWWDNPNYTKVYTVTSGKTNGRGADDYDLLTKDTLSRILGSRAPGKYQPGDLTGYLKNGKKTAVQIVTKYNDVIKNIISGNASRDDCIFVLDQIRVEFVKQNTKMDKLLAELTEAISDKKILSGEVLARAWERDAWKDLSYEKEFYACTFGAQESSINYIRNKTISMLDFYINGKGRCLRAITVAVKGANEDEKILLVDSVEGVSNVDFSVVKKAIEDYALACGFDKVFYSKHAGNTVPKKFLNFVSTEARPVKLKLELLDKINISHGSFLEAFNGATERKIEGYLVELESQRNQSVSCAASVSVIKQGKNNSSVSSSSLVDFNGFKLHSLVPRSGIRIEDYAEIVSKIPPQEGKVLEIGPSDRPCLSLLFLLNGAKEITFLQPQESDIHHTRHPDSTREVIKQFLQINNLDANLSDRIKFIENKLEDNDNFEKYDLLLLMKILTDPKLQANTFIEQLVSLIDRGTKYLIVSHAITEGDLFNKRIKMLEWKLKTLGIRLEKQDESLVMLDYPDTVFVYSIEKIPDSSNPVYHSSPPLAAEEQAEISEVKQSTDRLTTSIMTVSADTEKIHSANFKDMITNIQTQPQLQGLIIAVGTSWMDSYKRSEDGRSFKYPQGKDLNELIVLMRNYCESKGISFIDVEDDKLLSRISAERAKAGRLGAKVVVLAGKDTVESDNFASLRGPDGNAFVVGIDNQELEANSYIRLMEMLTIALKLSEGKDVSIDNAHIRITEVQKHHFYIFLPHAKPMNYEELKAVYQAQRSA